MDPVTSASAWEDLSRADAVEPYRDSIIVEVKPEGCLGSLLALMQPKLISPEMLEERDRLFCVAKMPLNDSDTMHM